MEPETGPRGLRTLLVVALLAAIYAGYARALDGELQFDDLRGIAENAMVHDLRLFLRPAMLSRIRVLTDLSIALNYRAAGLAVRPYHLVNLSLHCAVVLLAFALAHRLLRRAAWPAPFATAWLSAALFGLHPLQTEAVSYVYQRSEVLASLLYLVALLFALSFEEGRTPLRRAGACAAALLAFALAWSAKAIAVSFPAVLVLTTLAFPPANGSSPIRRAAWTLPFWVLAAALASQILTGNLHGNLEVGFAVPTVTPLHYFLTQPRVIWTYLRLLLWPSGQNVDWEFPASASLLEPRTALAFAGLAALVALALWLFHLGRDRRRLAARIGGFGILWFLLVLAPTCSFVPALDLIAEHRAYLASFGLCFAVAAAGVEVARRFARGPAVGAAVALAACLALGTALYRRNAVWESTVALWSDSAAKSPGKARPHMNLGYALVESDPQRALAELRIAEKLAAAGDRGVRIDQLEQNVAGALLGLHRTSEAVAVLESLLARQESAPLLNNTAVAYLEMGQLDKARSAAARAARRWPRYAPAHHTLGQIDTIEHRDGAALLHFQRAVELDPDSAISLASLALTQQRLGDVAAACASWSRYAHSNAPDAGRKAEQVRTALHCEAR